MSYDVVIAGGGIAGLTSAAFLCKAGYKVLICEKESKVGGLVNSFDYKGFTFDGGIRAIENIQRAVNGEKISFEWSHMNVHGEEISCEVHFTRLPSSKGVFIRGSIRYYRTEKSRTRIGESQRKGRRKRSVKIVVFGKCFA